MALLGSSRNNLISLNNKGNNTLMGLNVMLHTSETSLGIENLYGEPVVCISVIDEASAPGRTKIASNWINFRRNYPSRPFYLLQPTEPTGRRIIGDLYIPSDTSITDPVGVAPDYGLFYSEVNRDNGSTSAESNWFNICGLSTYPANTLVSLFIDTSGSMTLNTVKASYDKFLQDCEKNNIVVAGNSINEDENWIQDHNKTFSDLIDLITITRTFNQNAPFYSDGIFLEALQGSLLDKKIGNDLERFPNLYGYMGQKGRNSSAGTISITNPDGTLSINQSFMRGEATGTATSTTWVNDYYNNVNSHTINVCDVTTEFPNGGRLVSPDPTGLNSADVHGNIFSLFTTPNTIESQTAGFFGTVISSPTRRECYTLIITDSEEQVDGPGDLIDVNVRVKNDQDLTSIISGFNAKRYSGYFGRSEEGDDGTNDNVNYDQAAQLDTRQIPGYPNTMILNKIDKFFNGRGSDFNNKTWVISGFFSPPITERYIFKISSDDASYMHLKNPDGNFILEPQTKGGANVISPGSEGFTRNNALIRNGGTHLAKSKQNSIAVYLEQGVLYPIRFIYGNQDLVGPENVTKFNFKWKTSTSQFESAGNNIFFSNSEELIERKINDSASIIKSELQFRRYRVIALSSYESTDGYDGVLFYGSAYTEPYAYITFTGTNTNDYTITRSSTAPNWIKNTNQKQDTLTIAQETQGGLFKSSNVFQNGTTDHRKPFAEVISQFMEDTLN